LPGPKKGPSKNQRKERMRKPRGLIVEGKGETKPNKNPKKKEILTDSGGGVGGQRRWNRRVRLRVRTRKTKGNRIRRQRTVKPVYRRIKKANPCGKQGKVIGLPTGLTSEWKSERNKRGREKACRKKKATSHRPVPLKNENE